MDEAAGVAVLGAGTQAQQDAAPRSWCRPARSCRGTGWSVATARSQRDPRSWPPSPCRVPGSLTLEQDRRLQQWVGPDAAPRQQRAPTRQQRARPAPRQHARPPAARAGEEAGLLSPVLLVVPGCPPVVVCRDSSLVLCVFIPARLICASEECASRGQESAGRCSRIVLAGLAPGKAGGGPACRVHGAGQPPLTSSAVKVSHR
jgi:hypothetical protein